MVWGIVLGDCLGEFELGYLPLDVLAADLCDRLGDFQEVIGVFLAVGAAIVDDAVGVVEDDLMGAELEVVGAGEA